MRFCFLLLLCKPLYNQRLFQVNLLLQLCCDSLYSSALHTFLTKSPLYSYSCHSTPHCDIFRSYLLQGGTDRCTQPACFKALGASRPPLLQRAGGCRASTHFIASAFAESISNNKSIGWATALLRRRVARLTPVLEPVAFDSLFLQQ